MTTTQVLTVSQLCDDSPWDIADRLGIAYSGDVNPFDHDGYFYSTDDWAEYGYASCVKVFRADGRLFAEYATINRPDDLAPCFDCCGITDDDDKANVRCQIECAESYWGAEVSEDFGGRYAVDFADDDIDDDEPRFWGEIIGWIRGLQS